MDLNNEFSKFIQIAEKKRFNQAFFFSLSWTNLQRQTFHFPIVEFPVGEMKASLLVYHWKISVRKIVLSKLLPKKLFCGKIYRKHKKKQIWRREKEIFYFILFIVNSTGFFTYQNSVCCCPCFSLQAWMYCIFLNNKI